MCFLFRKCLEMSPALPKMVISLFSFFPISFKIIMNNRVQLGRATEMSNERSQQPQSAQNQPDTNLPTPEPKPGETISEKEAKELEERRGQLRVDTPEQPLNLTVFFRVEQQIITASVQVINFSLGGMLLSSNTPLPMQTTMKIAYKKNGIMIEALRQQGTMYGIRYHHSDMIQLYEFYLELIHDLIFTSTPTSKGK